VVQLRKRYRFAAGSAIADLADAACVGDADTALRVLTDANEAEVVWHPESTHATLVAMLADRYEPLLRMAQTPAEPEAVHALLRARGVLCAHRIGAHGAVTLNRAVENELRRRGLIAEQGAWFRGRPVMIARNDYAARLYNGDLGVTLIGADGRMGVYFPDQSGQLRRFAPARLPDCDSAFALTVHKSQGSEFEAVDFVLPSEFSPVLTRELFYTAVTRAARSVEVWGAAEVVRASLAARVVRDSALVERLWFTQCEKSPVQGTLFQAL
ncbi:MAG TPA: ATP-binding domain-containing protein, partial [Burkholderiales bacterium]